MAIETRLETRDLLNADTSGGHIVLGLCNSRHLEMFICIRHLKDL